MIGGRIRRRWSRSKDVTVTGLSADPEAAQIQQRYLQWRDSSHRAAAQWPPASRDVFGASVAVPDIPAAAMDLAAVTAGVQRHGAIIVRGLLDSATAGEMVADIDRVLDLLDPDAATADDGAAWRSPLTDPRTGSLVGPKWRAENAMFSGEASVIDSPHVAVKLLARFQQMGVADLVAGYLGEQPAVSLEKWTMRRVPPSTNTSWHQDGCLLGASIRSLNLWIALSDCGVDASGLDIVPHRIDSIVETGTEGAYFHWDVGTDVVQRELRGEGVLSPVFRPGDAVFFDQFLLHRTGVREGLTKDRYALETWFFAPSHFPAEYNGVMV